MNIRHSLVATSLLLTAAAYPAFAGKVLVMNDEWTLSNTGFSANPANAAQFALNIAQWATGGGTGSFLAYSGNFGLTESSLANTMTGAGHSWTVSMAGPFNAAALSAYDAVFLAGNPADNNELINYVNAGGTVILEGGTGWGGSVNEANQWKAFLNAFGLEYGTSYNGIGGNIATSSAHPLFSGVTSLYQNNGNSVLDVNLLDPASSILVSYQGQGLYGIYESRSNGVPDGGLTLAFLGMAGATLMAARRRIG